MKLLKRKNSGFTLIELLIVVMILAILAALFIANLPRVTERARMADYHAFIGAVRGSMEREALFESAYATTFDELDMDVTNIRVDANNVQLRHFACLLTSDGVTYTVDCTRGDETTGNVSARYGAFVLTYDVTTQRTTCTSAAGLRFA